MPSMLDGQRSPIGSLAKLGDGVRANSDSKTQAGLSRGAGQNKKLVNAAWTQTFPAQGATLDLDFANDRGFVRGVGQGRSMDAVTFTSASNGTFVKPDGTLSQHSNQGALGNNLLTFPQDFDNAVWAKSSLTLNANAILAPNGTTTGEKVILGTGSAFRAIETTFTFFAGAYTLSVYMKAGEYRFAQMLWGGGASTNYANFDLQAGSVTAGTYTSATITEAGDGWWRCTLTSNLLAVASSALPYAAISSGTDARVTNTTGDGTSGLFIWGAQLELGSTATEYFPTNINTPRFDWASTVQLGGNLLINSDYPTSWGYSSVAPTYNATTDPEGTNNAVLLTENNSSGHFASIGVSLVAGNTYTISAYFKDNTRRYASLVMSNFNNASSNFDLTNVVSVLGTGITASIEAVGNGWYRCSMTFTATNTTNSNAIFGLNNSANGLGSQSYVSEGKSLYLYAPQVNLGSTATTYFKTGAQLSTNTPLLANPTSNGLLIEESRANRILWCRDATQTNWTKTNVTAAKDQTGVDGVASSASSLTASSANGTCIQTITLASGSRTGSVYLKRITGTGTIQVTLDGTTYSTVDLNTSEWRRIVLSGTVTNPTVGIRIVTNGDAVAMDFGQVEDGAFVTTPILTTTASVTRAVDALSMIGSNFINWYNQNGGTFVADVFSPAIINSFVIQMTNSFGDRIEFGQSTSGNPTVRFFGLIYSQQLAANQFNAALDTSLFPLTYQKVVFSFKNSTTRLSSTNTTANNGFGVVQSTVRLPNNMNTTIIAHRGYIKRLTFFSTEANENVLRELVK